VKEEIPAGLLSAVKSHPSSSSLDLPHATDEEMDEILWPSLEGTSCLTSLSVMFGAQLPEMVSFRESHQFESELERTEAREIL
jgi:hypothetical protein